MKIGLIADLHANLPALHAVLEELQDVDQLWCAGDLTGYYTDPNGTIREVLSREILCIKGNHDHYLSHPPDNANSLLCQSIDMTRSAITAEHLAFLQGLTADVIIEKAGQRFLLCHGSPWDSLEEYIYPDYSEFQRFADVDADWVILGHTHYPMFREISGRKIINPGSCGQPRDGDCRASYAILDTASRGVTFHRVVYDASSLIEDIRALGLNEKLLRYLPTNPEKENPL